ncbi:hypothetical protein LSTR_LSTR014307 [Laodelphax striatellus]|uniref:Uncharacterized protein n=1 Tax=Laodelphax striatellus TaxID=195883 RepID=A0A482X032_LAOST|nr:hypothetical protein LSTR_LSTR014307 [Laodelphax striatellus]
MSSNNDGVTSLGGKTKGEVTSLDDTTTPRDTDAGRQEGVISEEEKGDMSLDALEDNCGTSLDREVGGMTSSNNDGVTSLGGKTEGGVTSLEDKTEGGVTSLNVENSDVTS